MLLLPAMNGLQIKNKEFTKQLTMAQPGKIFQLIFLTDL